MSDAIPADPAPLLGLLVDRVERGTLSRLGRTTPESLAWQPDPDANSIGVTVWHYTRWFDLLGTVTLVGGPVESQHWLRDGWASRTGYDPRGIGYGGLGLITGYTAEEMRKVPPLHAEARRVPPEGDNLAALRARARGRAHACPEHPLRRRRHHALRARLQHATRCDASPRRDRRASLAFRPPRLAVAR